jgi:hypothetical protein
VFCDNFYTSFNLFSDLLKNEITATGTLRPNRQGVPKDFRQLKEILDKKSVPRGTGFYICQPNSETVFVAWKDRKCVTMTSTGYPGHSTGTAKRVVKDPTGHHVSDVPIPTAIANYNKFMGGVDKSNQFTSYNRVLRKTVRYWKMMFYHLPEVVATNASIIHNWQRMKDGLKKISQTKSVTDLCRKSFATMASYLPQHPQRATPFPMAVVLGMI